MEATNTIYSLFQIAAIGIGVVVLVIAALFIWRAFKGKKAGKKGKLFTILYNVSATAVIAICLVVIIVLNGIVGAMGGILDTLMVRSYTPTDTSALATAMEIVYNIAEEGMVLMKNDNGALPLQRSSKVNVIGYSAYNPVYSGTGSGFVSGSDSVDIVSSLQSAGLEINPALLSTDVFAEVEDPNAGQSFGFIEPNFSKDEVAISAYTGDISFENLKNYSDIAILAFSRRGSEGADLPSDYLPLSADEEALLQAARDNFGTVIVIINSANALEMGWVDQYDVDAVIWAALPGPYGFEALGKILTGEVNPSGRLPDTWVYDYDSNPVSENFGEQIATNADGRFYVDYVEGIYVGYKWYETAYAEGAVVTNTKSGETFDYSNYDSIVAYPFGYGLSYTTFDQKITGGTLTDGTQLKERGKYTVEVTVTNTGNMAGKSVVQLYVTAPYTEYDKANLVEKAAASLIAYGKTDVLQPGASEVIKLNVSMEELASYDRFYDNGDGTTGTYMLDAGDYTFSVRSDAHNVVDSVTATMNAQYFFSGANKRTTDAVVASNQFDDAARGEYLSRQNSFANYASAMASVQPVIESKDQIDNNNLYDPALDNVVTKEYKEGVDYAAPGSLTLADMKGLDYDDPKWDQLISQMTIDELITLDGETMYASAAIDSIKKPMTNDADGPLGLSSMFKDNLVSVAFPCVPLLAGSFNTDLAYAMGSSVADLADLNDITSWYAPAMDTHRFAFSGRNYEYYSEDATLGAMTAVSETLGAMDKDAVVYIKHFALNDMETHRAYVHTYSNEQAIREIYLKPFEYAVKYGTANGVMSSMNFIGDTYAGAHMGLLTNVLRDEWSFVGTILTDMDESGEVRSFWASIRAGVDFWLGFSGTRPTVNSDADIYYLQRAAHNHLYQLINSNMKPVEVYGWRTCVNIICVELGLLAVVCVVGIVLRLKKGKKQSA